VRFDPRLVVHGDGKPQGAAPAIERLLALSRRPTAVLCYNDMSALGRDARIRSAGLRVPDDISIVGFDDLYISQYLTRPSPPSASDAADGPARDGNADRILSGARSQHNIKVPVS